MTPSVVCKDCQSSSFAFATPFKLMYLFYKQLLTSKSAKCKLLYNWQRRIPYSLWLAKQLLRFDGCAMRTMYRHFSGAALVEKFKNSLNNVFMQSIVIVKYNQGNLWLSKSFPLPPHPQITSGISSVPRHRWVDSAW